MAVPVKRSTKKAAPALPENSMPSEVLAAEILLDRSDVAPSVRRILDSTLGEEGRMTALSLFREALGSQGNPMRDPLKAIEAGRLVDPSISA
jgi:hypothetical protein